MPTPSRLKVLAVATEPEAQVLVREFQQDGREVDLERVATTAAVESALARPGWDLVLCSCSLPEVSPEQALALLQGADRDAPLILICDRADAQRALALVRGGADDAVERENLARLGPAVARELRAREVRRARRHAEEALSETVLQYRALMDASTDAVFLESLEGRVLDCNKAACEMFGYTKDEMVKLSVADLVPEDVAATLPRVITEHLTTGGIFIEAKNKRKNGELFPVEVSTRLIRLDGEEWVVAYVRDITRHKRASAEHELMARHAEEAKERELLERTNRLTSLGLLAAGVAHEVNNPLQGMLSHLSAVKKALPPDFPKRKNVAMVERGIEMISALVQKLLALSREPTGKRPTAVYGEAMDFVVQLLEHQFKHAGITIVRKDEKTAWRLAIPQRELVQVLLNLFINAKDAMPQGGRLTVTSRGEDGWCRITLADTGVGIPKRVLGQIFSPFFTTKGRKGTGLGLSVAESIIRHCGGAIEVESQTGKGSRFHLRIPLAGGKRR